MTKCQPCNGLSRATHTITRAPIHGAVDPELVCEGHMGVRLEALADGEWVTIRAIPKEER